ncbi:MAG: HAD family hydrolase [Butyrivibrio sp.]|nr:HAD family hydrolase [Butyrivibrio sp.]
MGYKYIFFDLDGTLTDSGEGIVNSVVYALARFGIEAERGELYKFVGPPLFDSFREFCGFSESDVEKAVAYYREYFADKGIFENKVYDGIEEVLSRLRESGRRLYVATSKPSEYSVRILDKFGLSKYFEYVSGSSLDEKDSSKAAIIERAVRHSGAALSDILMVGDRKFDIEGAKTNRIAAAGVLYGYGSRRELEEAGADYIAENARDLLRIAEG